MNQKTKGIMCILGAAFFFALMNLFVRLSGDLPFYQKSFFRNVIAMLVALMVLVKDGTKISLEKKDIGLLVLRATFGTIGILCNFYAIDHMNISDASMLNKLSPFFAIVFSYFLLKEKANVVDWVCVLVAFVGSLFIVKPSFSMEVVPALIGLAGGLGAGIAYTMVRILGNRKVKGTIIVFFFSCFSTVVLLPMTVLGYQPMQPVQFLLLILAGMSATGGQFCITAAYTFAPAKEISVFDYSQVVFAALLGFAFLGQIPDRFSVIGYVIIGLVAVVRWKYNGKKE